MRIPSYTLTQRGKSRAGRNKPWKLVLDDVLIAKGINYGVKADCIWQGSVGMSSYGKKMQIDMKVLAGITSDLNIQIHERNRQYYNATQAFLRFGYHVISIKNSVFQSKNSYVALQYQDCHVKIWFVGREFAVGKHDGKREQLKQYVMREDANDGKVVIKTTCHNGPNLMVTANLLVLYYFK